jgi:hypothetical protein
VLQEALKPAATDCDRKDIVDARLKIHTMKRPYKSLVVLAVIVLLLASSFEHGNARQTDTQKAFFKNLKKMCGQQFEGETTFPLDVDHPMAGKKLVMSVASCGKQELRIPFQVGEDKSRTWILTLTEKGLLFKHDHRHADGTPDKITMYGGWADKHGTAYLQRFPSALIRSQKGS